MIDKRSLAASLVELERDPESAVSQKLLDEAWRTPKAHVVGVTGPPGVGKSSLCAALVAAWRRQGRTVGVIAVDPSSKATGGALLGDRVRIVHDSADSGSFVRSMAARDRLGGLADQTIAAMVLMRALFDRVLIETVGVGQSETAVADMVDMFIVLLLPAGGDDLQGIKRGVIELADIIVVNKADGDLKATALRSAADYQHALRMLRSPTAGWTPEVTTASALTGEGVLDVWAVVERFAKAVGAQGIARRRAEQALHQHLHAVEALVEADGGVEEEDGAEEVRQQGDAAHGGAGGHAQALVGVVEAVQHPLVQDRRVVGDQGVAGVAQEVVEIAKAGGETAGGVGVAARKDQLGVLKPESLGGFAHDRGGLAVDQLHSRQTQSGFTEVAGDALDGVAIEVATELVVATDQTGDGIAHGEKGSTHLGRKVAPANGQIPCQSLHLTKLTETVTQGATCRSSNFWLGTLHRVPADRKSTRLNSSHRT